MKTKVAILNTEINHEWVNATGLEIYTYNMSTYSFEVSSFLIEDLI